MSFENKSKNRSPIETIEIIKRFFDRPNFKLKFYETKSDVNTCSYMAYLFYKNKRLLFTNGKGMTPEFALASCLAELYERFCQGGQFRGNNTFRRKIFEVNSKLYGYNFAADEQVVDPMTTLNNAPGLMEAFSGMSKEHIEMLTSYIVEHKSVCVPYKSIHDDSTVLLDPRLITTINNSTGMAAGNSFKEAFNQAYSEILERNVLAKFMMDEYDKLYVLKNSKIQNKELKDRIDLIESEGKKAYVIDFSYNEGMPVVGLVIIDLLNKRPHVDLGSFAIADIAAERCITELWQNKQNISVYGGGIISPYAAFTKKEIVENYVRSLSNMTTIPDSFFEKIVEVDHFNNDAFLDDSASIDDIFEYYKLLDKKFNFNSYCRDYSLCNEMFSIQIVPTNLLIRRFSILSCDENMLDWDYIKHELESTDILVHEIFSNKPNVFNIHHIIANMHRFKMESDLLDFVYFRDPTVPLDDIGIWYRDARELQLVANPEFSKNGDRPSREYEMYGSLYFEQAKKFELINVYKNCGYSKEKITELLGIYGIVFSDEDFVNSKNFEYLLDKIYISTSRDYYFSDEYFNLIKEWFSFVKLSEE